MKCIQKKPINKSRNCYRLGIIAFLILFMTGAAAAEQKFNWVDIHLEDNPEYLPFRVSRTINDKYPPSNVFDGRTQSCWVTHTDTRQASPDLFIRLPEGKAQILNLFSGYGKSRKLFGQNARPRKVRLSVFAAVNPEGYVSETGALFKAVEFPKSLVITLEDTFAVQHIPLAFDTSALYAFRKRVHAAYTRDNKTPIADSCLILQLRVLNSIPGSKYNDVCISELYFSDRFVSTGSKNAGQINKVYLNADENTLLVDDTVRGKQVVYRDIASVLQLLEVSHNKKWAILIAMPAEIEGRTETTYLLADLQNKTVVNSSLEKSIGRNISANALFFEESPDGRLYVRYNTFDDGEQRIELK